MSTHLPDLVHAALLEHRGEWQAIASASGVSYSWMSKFMNGRISNPGYTTLRKLHDCMEGMCAEQTVQKQGATSNA